MYTRIIRALSNPMFLMPFFFFLMKLTSKIPVISIARAARKVTFVVTAVKIEPLECSKLQA